jgi:periplasmic divalent cation tolerance protein
MSHDARSPAAAGGTSKARTEGRPLVALSTVESVADAERIASTLVEERLAACVNVIGGLRSIYRWQGSVQRDDEVLLVIKTTRARFGELRQRLLAEHPYDVPELIALDVADGALPYLDWIRSETTAAPDEAPDDGDD